MIKPLIILLYLSKEAFDAVIEFLDSQYLRQALPENVRDVYNEEEYRNWLSYEKECGRMDMISDVCDIILALSLLASDAYAWLFEVLSGISVYLQYLALILLLSVISSVIDIPFAYYKTFVISMVYVCAR